MNGFSAPVLLSRARRWRGLISLGLAEQILLSGSSFGFTAVQAHLLGPERFGEFSIAFAIFTLLETSMWGVFGDAVPETAHRLPLTLWPAMRSSVLLLSMVCMAGVAVLVLLASAILAVRAPEIAGTLAAAIATLFAARLQNGFRRLYYLDNLRVPTALGAVAYAGTLAGTAGILILFRASLPQYGMLCLAAASAASCAVFFLLRPPLERPDRRMLWWTMQSLWRTGRWILVTSVMSWAGNLGVVPLVGLISSVSLSGTLRAVQTLTTPMSQLNMVLMSIIVPNAARKLRDRTSAEPLMIAVQTASLIGGFACIYSLFVTSAGRPLFHLLFGATANGMTRWVVGAAAFGYALESIRFGVNAVLLGLGRTRILFYSQCCATTSLIIVLPFAAHFGGLLGMVLTMTAANNLGSMISASYFLRYVLPSVGQGREYGAIATDGSAKRTA